MTRSKLKRCKTCRTLTAHFSGACEGCQSQVAAAAVVEARRADFAEQRAFLRKLKTRPIGL